jgi:hypothetical protein
MPMVDFDHLSRTEISAVKANGAARKAHERDKRATETRLHGWACETRTQKRRRKISL